MSEYDTYKIEIHQGSTGHISSGPTLDICIENGLDLLMSVSGNVKVKIIHCMDDKTRTIVDLPERDSMAVRFILDAMRSNHSYLEETSYSTVVTKSGNSLIIKVTDQCKLMGLKYLDPIDVVLRRAWTEYDDQFYDYSVFKDRDSRPVSEPEMFVDGDSDISVYRAFIEDFNISGMVSLEGLNKSVLANYLNEDNSRCLKTEDGEIIIMSMIDKNKLGFVSWRVDTDPALEVGEFPKYCWKNPEQYSLVVTRLRTV